MNGGVDSLGRHGANAFSPGSLRFAVRYLILLLSKLLLAICLAIPAAYSGARVTLSAEGVKSPFLNFKGVHVSLSGSNAPILELKLDEIMIEDRRWRDVQFLCRVFHVSASAIRCDDGVLRAGRSASLPLTFLFSAPHKTLEAGIRNTPGVRDGWRLFARWSATGWEGTMTAENGEAAQIAAFLPVWESGIETSSAKGKINGVLRLNGNSGGLAGIDAELSLDSVAFSDAAGLHAGENIDLELNAKAKRDPRKERGRSWQWDVNAIWPNGEIFWQPLYFAGRGHRFNAAGELYEENIQLREGRLVLGGIGEVNFSGTVDSEMKTLREFDVVATNLELSGLFDQVLQPFLVNTPFAGLKASGQAGVHWQYRDRAHQLLNVYLRDASVKDGNNRFAFEGVNAHIPWQADGGAAKKGKITIGSSHIARLPIGPVHIPLEITGLDQPGVRIARMIAPVLDGQFVLEEFNAQRQAPGEEKAAQGIQASGEWQWEFTAKLAPLSMQKLTEVLEIKTMQGTLSGEIPKISYKDAIVNVEGALVLRVFDGSVVVWNLKAVDPFGPASSLIADMDMRNLDLELLTGTFSFGKMLGRIDLAVHNLELFGWKPVRFDISLKSSLGDYPRRISQDAVQNISSLGGSGAAAAIQRSALRFFDEFGYSQIGWSCVLRNGICRMGGIASLPHGYLIVKGGGIPAITVIGYNRDVDWLELVSRLQRITRDNAKPIIQ